jgi:hypothetical protein
MIEPFFIKVIFSGFLVLMLISLFGLCSVDSEFRFEKIFKPTILVGVVLWIVTIIYVLWK